MMRCLIKQDIRIRGLVLSQAQG